MEGSRWASTGGYDLASSTVETRMEERPVDVEMNMRNEHDIDVDDLRAAVAETVAFIDAWLAENAWIADTRTIDFALDLRHLLLADGRRRDDHEPVSTPA